MSSVTQSLRRPSGRVGNWVTSVGAPKAEKPGGPPCGRATNLSRTARDRPIPSLNDNAYPMIGDAASPLSCVPLTLVDMARRRDGCAIWNIQDSSYSQHRATEQWPPGGHMTSTASQFTARHKPLKLALVEDMPQLTPSGLTQTFSPEVASPQSGTTAGFQARTRCHRQQVSSRR